MLTWHGIPTLSQILNERSMRQSVQQQTTEVNRRRRDFRSVRLSQSCLCPDSRVMTGHLSVVSGLKAPAEIEIEYSWFWSPVAFVFHAHSDSKQSLYTDKP